MHKVLKKFRSNFRSNVTCKLLMSMICKWLSSWLERNNGISHGQRAVFSRKGVMENTFIVAESLRSKKGVLYLDLSHAFNSVEHSTISEALRQSHCPEWIIRIIQSVYSDCTTQPTDLSGKTLCDPVKISRGVRQGCPLSALLFNVVLVLEDASELCGPAVVLEDASEAPGILQKIVDCANSLGLTFNPAKDGAANISKPLTIGDQLVPVVTEEKAYKYLGTTVFPSIVGGLESCFERAWALAQLIEDFQLSLMQKLHALRTKTIPMLYHLLAYSFTNQNQLHRMNRSLRKMAKRILCLPEKATTAYINLNRLYGGPGLSDLVITKARMTLKSFVNAYNIKDSLETLTRKLLLHGSSDEEVIRAKNQNKRWTLGDCQRNFSSPATKTQVLETEHQSRTAQWQVEHTTCRYGLSKPMANAPLPNDIKESYNLIRGSRPRPLLEKPQLIACCV